MTVAQRSFLENGYAATTMSAIAATLGGSKGTLWNHFPSKGELFAAVLENATTVYRARLSQILDEPGDLVPTLKRICISLLSKITSPEAIALHRLVVSEAGRFPEMGRIFYQLAPRHTRMMLAGFLGGAMARGQLRQDDPVTAARVLMTLCMSGCHQMLIYGQLDHADDAAIETDASFALDMFLRAYAVEGPRSHA